METQIHRCYYAPRHATLLQGIRGYTYCGQLTFFTGVLLFYIETLRSDDLLHFIAARFFYICRISQQLLLSWDLPPSQHFVSGQYALVKGESESTSSSPSCFCAECLCPVSTLIIMLEQSPSYYLKEPAIPFLPYRWPVVLDYVVGTSCDLPLFEDVPLSLQCR